MCKVRAVFDYSNFATVRKKLDCIKGVLCMQNIDLKGDSKKSDIPSFYLTQKTPIVLVSFKKDVIGLTFDDLKTIKKIHEHQLHKEDGYIYIDAVARINSNETIQVLDLDLLLEKKQSDLFLKATENQAV